MQLQCPRCEADLDDSCCMARQIEAEDDASLAMLFEDYKVELWQCPRCRQHVIRVEIDMHPLKSCIFRAEFITPGASGVLVGHPLAMPNNQ